MSIKYLSSSGLTEVWSNIKAYIASKIPSKIVTGLSIEGRTITYTNSDGTTGTLTTQDTNTDAKVTQTVTTTNAEYPVLFSVDANKTATSTTTARFSSNIKINPSTNTVTATTFKGNLSGTATKATQDASGNVIVNTYATKSELGTKANDSAVVHTTGNETIAGTKTFSNVTYSNKELRYKDTKYDWTDTSLDTWCDAGHVAWFDKTGSRRMHELVGTRGGVWNKACYINEKPYFSVDSNRNISYWGTSTTFDGHVFFNGYTIFTQDITFKNNNIDLTVTPSSTLYSNFIFMDKNNQHASYIQYVKRNTEPDILGLYIKDKDKNSHGIQITSNNYLLPAGNNIWSLGSPNNGWSSAYITTITCNGTLNLKMTGLESNTTTPTSAQYENITVVANDGSQVGRIQFSKRADGSFDATIYSYGGSGDGNNGTLRITSNNEVFPINNNKTKLGTSTTKWSEVWANTFNGNLSGTIASSTTATTQASTDNSTKIATTAWVRTYVNSVSGSNTVGSSVSAYWSNSSNVTAKGSHSSSGGYYPSDYSDYINIAPTAGTIYSGAQLYTVINASASATVHRSGSSGDIFNTTTSATATFSSPISTTGKYLCTTANSVKFRGYTAKGDRNAPGTSSVVDNTSTKSIFIRVE